MPIAIRTSPTSIRTSGFGVVSKLPSGLPSAMITAPVVLRMRRSRIELPARSDSRVTTISSKRMSGPPCEETISRKAATCGLSASFAISVPAEEYGWTTRSAPARVSFRSASASDALATIVRSGRRARAERVM